MIEWKDDFINDLDNKYKILTSSNSQLYIVNYIKNSKVYYVEYTNFWLLSIPFAINAKFHSLQSAKNYCEYIQSDINKYYENNKR